MIQALLETLLLILNVIIAFTAYLCGILVRSNFKNATLRRKIYKVFFLIFAFIVLNALFLAANKNDTEKIAILSSTLATTFFLLIGIIIGNRGIFSKF